MKPSAVLKEGHKDITLMLQIVEKVSQQLEKKRRIPRHREKDQRLSVIALRGDILRSTCSSRSSGRSGTSRRGAWRRTSCRSIGRDPSHCS